MFTKLLLSLVHIVEGPLTFGLSHNHKMIQLCKSWNSISALKEIDYEASVADVAFDLFINNNQIFKFQTFGRKRVLQSMQFICVDSFLTQPCHHWSTER